MMQQMTNRDAWPEVGQLRYVFPDIIIDRQLALLCQQHDCRGSELLRYRCNVEDRSWCNRHAVLEVGHAVPTSQDQLVLLHDAHGATWRLRTVVSAKDRINATLQDRLLR